MLVRINGSLQPTRVFSVSHPSSPPTVVASVLDEVASELTYPRSNRKSSLLFSSTYTGAITIRNCFAMNITTPWELEDAGVDSDGQSKGAAIFLHAAGAVILKDTAV